MTCQGPNYAHQASENEELLAQDENLPVLDDHTTLFSRP